MAPPDTQVQSMSIQGYGELGVNTQSAPKRAPVEVVDANEIGITKDVFARGITLTKFCRMSYPGGKDIETLDSHIINREEFASNSEDSFLLDSKRLQDELDKMNHGKPADHQFKAEIFRADKLQGVIYHNDHEVIVSFEGSDGLEWKHYLRNLIKSPISLQPRLFFHDLWRNGKLDQYEEKIEAMAKRIAEPEDAKDPKKLARIIKNLKEAKVHKGWWDSLNLPLLFGPDIREGETIWSGMERHLETILADIETRNGKAPKLTFTGHSSGGSLSMIASARWMGTHDKLADEIYTFGQPRTGNIEFRRSMYEFMDRTGTPPIYRFEMDGDPVPSLPPLWSIWGDHLRHCGNLIWIAPNGTLLSTRYDGKIVTAQEAGNSLHETMSSYYRTRNRSHPMLKPLDIMLGFSAELPGTLLKQMLFVAGHQERFVIAPESELEAMWDKRNLKDSWDKDAGASNFIGTLLDLAAHLSNISSYRHVLPTMQEALRRQLRMIDLREKNGGGVLTPIEIKDMLMHLTEALLTARKEGALDAIPNIDNHLAVLDLDKAAFVKAALEDTATAAAKLKGEVPKVAPELQRAAVYLANSRSTDPQTKLHELSDPASLVAVAEALKGHKELEGLRNQTKEVLHQLEYFVARRAPIKVDKHSVRVLQESGNGHNGHSNGHGR